MRLKEVTLEPLRSKHYETELTVETIDGSKFYIDISGYSSVPSQREIESGWEPDMGMNHVEGQEHHIIALIIKQALEGWK